MREWKPRIGYEEMAAGYAKTVRNCLDEIEQLKTENQRLRWFYENMRDADRRLLQIDYEKGRGNG